MGGSFPGTRRAPGMGQHSLWLLLGVSLLLIPDLTVSINPLLFPCRLLPALDFCKNFPKAVKTPRIDLRSRQLERRSPVESDEDMFEFADEKEKFCRKFLYAPMCRGIHSKRSEKPRSPAAAHPTFGETELIWDTICSDDFTEFLQGRHDSTPLWLLSTCMQWNGEKEMASFKRSNRLFSNILRMPDKSEKRSPEVVQRSQQQYSGNSREATARPMTESNWPRMSSLSFPESYYD